ncbi:nucleoprotein TPR isoform X2 [Octopus sinensis]|uniref:Nucleoprotein TPR isoform X2 n=1 Tax=Octopus sinensis TaxID=2607531 RepID=A0A7E6EHL9_9MOLL|nr:nucleoprotein TPR isoform X2 [Octopus sinensis]
MFQGPHFDEGDDCTVPSTPTLFVPRRGDGFAEALSYPQVPQRFVFGTGEGVSHSELESQGALGMDDTRMDLSQFDDGQVRNLPFTSHQVTTSGGSATVVFSNFAVSSTPPQQLLQGDSTNKEPPPAKEGTSSASSTDTPKEDIVTEEMGLRKSKIQPIVWDQSPGASQQQVPATPLLQNPTSSSTISTPSTSAGLSSGKGREEFVWASNPTPTPSTNPSPAAATSTSRGSMMYSTRGVRCATRGRGAIMRGHPTRSPIARGHVGRSRGPSRTPGVRGRSLRRKN